MRCNLGAKLCVAARKPGRLAPGLLAFGAAVRLMEILLRRRCAVVFDMVDAHTGSPPCHKAVHNMACALRSART